MEFQRRNENGLTVLVTESSRFDTHDAIGFNRVVERTIRGDDRCVLIDLSTVEYVDSAGLGALLTLRDRLSRQQGELVLVGLRPQVQELVEMVRLGELFRTFPDVRKALDVLSAEPT